MNTVINWFRNTLILLIVTFFGIPYFSYCLEHFLNKDILLLSLYIIFALVMGCPVIYNKYMRPHESL